MTYGADRIDRANGTKKWLVLDRETWFYSPGAASAVAAVLIHRAGVLYSDAALVPAQTYRGLLQVKQGTNFVL